MYDIIELSRKLLPDLKEIAKELDIKKIESFKKQDLIYKILDTQAILASEKKSDDKKLKSPRDINVKREESSVFKLFSRRKEEKPTTETPEEIPTVEKPVVASDNEPKREGKREFQIKKRPRTEHIKAGSSNHNPNQNQNPKQNINPNQRQNQNPKPDNNQKQSDQPKFNQNQRVKQEILFPEDPKECFDFGALAFDQSQGSCPGAHRRPGLNRRPARAADGGGGDRDLPRGHAS